MALTQVKTTGLADDAVTGAKIADDTVAEANMANDAISLSELKAGTDGQIITYDASGNPTAVGPGTDGQVLTSTGAGSPPAFETPAPGVGGATGVDFNDNVKIRSGTDQDIQIYHDGSVNRFLLDGETYFNNKANDECFIITKTNGAVELYHNGSKKIETTTTGATVTGAVKANNIVTENLVTNGSMLIWERPDATSTTTTGYSSADHWYDTTGNIGQTSTKSRQSLTNSDGPWADGHRYYLRKTLAAAGNANTNADVTTETSIESQDMATCGWDYKSTSSYITISFWARASAGQTFYMYLYNADSGYVYLKDFTVATNTWGKHSFSIPGNSNLNFNIDSGAGLTLRIIQFYGTDYTNNRSTNSWASYSGSNFAPDMASTWLTAGASTFDLTGVQCQAGDAATDFHHRSFGDELRRCQRYYYKHAHGSDKPVGNGSLYQDNNLYMYIKFPVPMRGAPNLKYSVVTDGYYIYSNSGSDGFNEWHTLWSENNNGTLVNAYSSNGISGRSATHTSMTITNHATAYIAFEAEI